MTKSTSSQHLPNRDEFVAFWEARSPFRPCRVAPFAIYLGGLALAAIASQLTDTLGRAAIPVLFGAIAFVMLYPILYTLIVWRVYDRFIRCPQCRDWIGNHTAENGRRWVTISETGCCPKCGAQMLDLEEK